MRTWTLETAREQAEKANKDLRADDPRFNQSAMLVTRDSHHFFDNAFIYRYGPFLAVFCEHHAPVVEPVDEVVYAAEYQVLRVVHEDRL